MKSLFKYLRAIAHPDIRSVTQRKSNPIPFLLSKATGLFFLLTAIQLLIPAKAEAVPLSLKRTFTGYYDYVVTGGTLRTNPNSVNACTVGNSNTASLSGIPATATIKAAYLYWTGSGTTSDSTVTFQGQSVTADTTLTDTFTLSGTSYQWFSGIKDVTSIVTATRNGNYTLSDLSVATGNPWCNIQGVLSGWALIVVYEDTTTVTRPFAINLYDGFSASRNSFQDFTLSGIKVSNAPVSKFTALLWEGDQSLGGTDEFFSFQGNKLSDSYNAVDNPFNSSINTLNLGADSVYGVDLDTFNVSAYTTPGLTSVTGRVSSNNDLVILSAAVVGITTLAADLEVTKAVSTPNPIVGQNITYTVTVTNKGPDNTTGVIVKDVLPSQVTHVSNDSGGSYNPTNGNWNVSNLNVGESKTLNITVTVNAAGTFSNNAEVTASNLPDLDSTPNNNNATEDDQASVLVTSSTTTTISGTLYEDTDGGDDLDASEPKLPANITVKLLDSNNNVIKTTLTQNDGTYTFTGVTNGNYKIQVDTTDTDIPSSYTLGTANDLAVTVSGSPVTGKNFGFDPPPPTYSVSGTLYEDTDGGDDFDNGETTLPANITVKLLDSNNNVVTTTTTAANGTYTFTNVNNGSYKIQVDTSDTDIPSGYTLGTTNNVAITVSGANASNINFGFDSPPPSGNPYCQSSYNEVYSGQSGNKIFAVHGPTGAAMQLTSSALAGTVNSVATDHNNHLVYYAEGTSVYAWDAINNTHITITNNIRSFNSSLPTNSTLLSAGGAAFYNGSLYLGVDPPQAGVFEIYKVNFVSGSNGRTIQSVTPLNINGAGKANGQLNNGDWGDFIISNDGVIYGSSGGTAKYWSFDLNTNTFTDLTDNIPESSQLAKDGTGRLWAFRNGTNSVVQIEIVGNAVQTVGTANSTSSHSSADGAECVTGLSSIGDRIWDDINGDGVQDSGEGGFANVTVALYRDIDGDGVIDVTDPQLATQTTDANGNYDFTGLIFGNYIVKVTDTNQVLTGKTITTGTNTKAVNLPTGIQDYNNADFGFNQPVPSNPNVLLVKRITAINGSSFTDLIDGVNDSNSPNYVPTPRDTDDNNANWPSNYLQGLINGGTVRPNDEIEYTIYFLSAGDATAPKVLMCDRVPNNVTFIPTAFNSFTPKNGDGLPTANRGIIWQYNGNTQSLTNTKDGDVAQYFPPGVEPSTVYNDPNNPSKKVVDCGGANTNGAVVVNLGDVPNATNSGQPLNSYGFIRFRGRVK